ncbi:MAG: UDP-N-acetylglucosamine 1-carboxyvinyltransferase [Candidatus Pacebacteria bacterium]|nr:UDP-N-acetylglucosamine 1-carboxyvinyltransferase [Candidatus Paceibacterota bacterium]MDR3583307.1 UDP-N-acetylglucosamine 1-carboxyvinyltransferase [Candidatus Paceibacterota bacterium]
MEHFEITGGRKLSGEINVRGSKNATTPILAATVLTKEECILSNVPLIEDVFRMVEILESMGSEIKWLNERKISIKNDKIDPLKMDVEKVKRLRSSILLLGSLSGRFDNFKIYHPGGCVIGKRPLGTHFDAMAKMGIDIKQKEKFYLVDAKKRKTGKIILREFSVTATENAMMLAAALPGKTIIKIAAAEPHVEDLGKFLVSMGAKIKGLGTHTLEITGVKKLCGTKHVIIPDANEAATFLIMGVATDSPIKVNGAREEHLELVLEKLREFGADFKIGKNFIQVIPAEKLKAVSKIDMRIYPGVPSDVQAPLGVLATQAEGHTLIFDTLFDGRFNYVNELEKMGAKAYILNPHQVVISGPTKLHGNGTKSFDLRAGASLIIAALVAEGKTVIEDIYQVDRGYEKIEERLQKLGAEIKRLRNTK